MRDTAARPRIDILAVPEATAGVIYGLHDLLLSAGRDWPLIMDGTAGPSLLEPRIAGTRIGRMTITNGVVIEVAGLLEAADPPQVACIPELTLSPYHAPDGRFEAEVDWVQRCYRAGALIATSCSGAVLLAEGGLLAGEEATTHWAYCDVLRRYPDVKVREHQALVVAGDGGRLVMAGGGTSWLDLGLYITARLAGTQEAMRVARVNLIDWHDIGQQPFASLARSAQSEDALIARCQLWIAEHYAEPAPVAGMARVSGLAERSFKRRFRLATGMSPLEYVHALRLEEAKHLLETGDLPIAAIAAEVGYEDVGFFSRLFKRRVRLTPGQYRRRFAGLRRALAGQPAYLTDSRSEGVEMPVKTRRARDRARRRT